MECSDLVPKNPGILWLFAWLILDIGLMGK